MHNEDLVLRLVGLIYEAGLNPARWPTFLDALAEALHGHTALLFSINPDVSLSVVAAGRADPEFINAYTGGYGERDPWLLAGRSQRKFRPGVVCLGEQVVSSGDVRKTEYYNDFGRRFHSIGGVAAVVATPGSPAVLSTSYFSFGQFGAEELTLFATLAPHVERALALHHRLTNLEVQQRAAADVLDRIPVAAVLVDRDAKPTLVNRAAQRLIRLRDGVHSTADGLAANRSSETRRLRQMIAMCAATTAGSGFAPGGTLTLSRRSQPPLHILVSPVRTGYGLDAALGTPAAIVFIHDRSQRAVIEPAILQDLYGLTRAESRVASLIASGATVAEIAARLGVSVSTVRTHVKRLFNKTEARTQSQLVQSLLAGLATLTE